MAVTNPKEDKAIKSSQLRSIHELAICCLKYVDNNDNNNINERIIIGDVVHTVSGGLQGFLILEVAYKKLH